MSCKQRKTSTRRNLAATLIPVLLVSLPLAAAASTTSPSATAAIDTSLSLPTDREGAVFGSLTVEGENRVQIFFERPELDLDLDAGAAPGLTIDGPLDILDRTRPDLAAPLVDASSVGHTPHTARPWVTGYEAGPVVRFHSSVTGAASWNIKVMDSTGKVVMVFAGKGAPPAGIAWDGMKMDGTPAACGLTYSYVLEAHDAAGNKRRIVGDGFSLPAYRLEMPEGPVFLASGDQWQNSRREYPGHSPLLLEAASSLNLGTEPTDPVAVTVTARTREQAEDLARQVAADITPLLGGASDRVVPVLRVEPGSPAGGTLQIGPAPTP